ncbi:MAG: hypothetical protein R3335_05400 [Anaerolineales bacterium]|nr:hypothetical protein [Anaerolineales bacterium]
MATLMTLLRIIHIFSGALWVGGAFINVLFLQPTFQATAPESQRVIQHLNGRTRFLVTVYSVATLSVLSGLIMFAILSEFRPEYFATPYGTFLTIGALAGIIVWLMVIFGMRRMVKQLGAIGAQIQAQGGPPTPEQAAEMGAISARLTRLGQISLVLLAIALFGMSTAQYAGSFF